MTEPDAPSMARARATYVAARYGFAVFASHVYALGWRVLVFVKQSKMTLAEAERYDQCQLCGHDLGPPFEGTRLTWRKCLGCQKHMVGV